MWKAAHLAGEGPIFRPHVQSKVLVSIRTRDQDGYKFSLNSNMFVARSRKSMNNPLHKAEQTECTALLFNISLELPESLEQECCCKI